MSTRVLVADALATEHFDDLRASGVDIRIQPELGSGDLPGVMAGVKILVVRSTRVTAETIAAANDLALIVRAGSGVNTIDVAAASARGIYVANCPGKNSVAVAELTIGLMLALDRRIPDNCAALREGRWNKKAFSKARGIKGQRLGLVGFGAIAREVATRAQAFGMHVTAYSRSLTNEQAETYGVSRAASLEHIFRDSDVVSLHLPATEETRGLIGGALISQMKGGAMLLNTARSEIVDEAALIEAARAGLVRVGTDVYAGEPEVKEGEYKDVLGTLPNVVGTHHIGASTQQAQDEIALETVRIVRVFCESGEVLNPVNLLLNPETAGTMVIRHLDKVGVLASVLTTLRGANINVETMDNIIFSGGKAACARIRISDWPGKELVAEISSLDNVIHVEVV